MVNRCECATGCRNHFIPSESCNTVLGEKAIDVTVGNWGAGFWIVGIYRLLFPYQLHTKGIPPAGYRLGPTTSLNNDEIICDFVCDTTVVRRRSHLRGKRRKSGAMDRVRLRSGEFRLLEFISSTDGWPWLILERSRVYHASVPWRLGECCNVCFKGRR